MKNRTTKTYTLDELKDEFIGKSGTSARNHYEHKLNKKIIKHSTKSPSGFFGTLSIEEGEKIMKYVNQSGNK